MGFLDNIGETVASTGKVIGNKTKEVAGSTKLSIQINQEETRLQKAYAALGEAYYKNNLDDMPDQYSALAADIKECVDKLESLTSDKESIKNQKRCPSCGAWVPNDAKFCGKCGAKIDDADGGEKVEEDGDAEEKEDEPGVCPSCGAVIEDPSTSYCSECGAKLK